MKISQKQAYLLAKEVVRQLQQKRVHKVSELTKAKVKEFCDKRMELIRKKSSVQEEINKHEASLGKVLGMSSGAWGRYGDSSQQRIIEQLEKVNIPSVQQIEDEIVLKSMFASEDDMQSFIDKIVKSHEKKLQAKTVLN